MSICIACGEPIPEGRQVCWKCEHAVNDRILLRKDVSRVLKISRYYAGQFLRAYGNKYHNGTWYIKQGELDILDRAGTVDRWIEQNVRRPF